MIKEPKKFAYIDTLRGLAILGVLMIHFSQHISNKYPNFIKSIVANGKYGVQLFFIVSALTLFMSMKERSVQEKHPVLNFFIRRFFRIAPLFYTAILYYLWEDGLGPRFWLGNAPNISMFNILASFSFTNGINPYWINSLVPGGWTVAVEMTFYLFLPLLYKTVRNLKSALLFTAIALFCSQLLDSILHKHILISDNNLWNHYLYLYFPSQLPIFLLGIILFYLIKNQQNVVSEDNNQNSSFVNFWLVIAALLMAILVLKGNIPYYFLLSVVFVISAYSLSSKPIKLLVNKYTIFLGKISFSLYLTHFAVLHYMDEYSFVFSLPNRILNFGLKCLMFLGGSVSISFITYTFIEKPGQVLGKKLINLINK